MTSTEYEELVQQHMDHGANRHRAEEAAAISLGLIDDDDGDQDD